MRFQKLSDTEVDQMISEEAKRHNADFEWTYTEEPHATRRRQILKDHPEIKKLFGHSPKSKYYCIATVALQCFLAYYCSRPSTSWGAFFFLAYVVGGTCNHSLTLAIHEMSHNLFFKKAEHNHFFAFFANIPLVIPYSASFKKYHLEHHKYQGVDGVDTDIPTAAEGKLFTTPFRKFLWVLFQPFFYAIRPLMVNPKPLQQMDYLNICSQVICLSIIVKVCGAVSMLYLLLATFFGLGFHPCAGHFIAEHYTNLSSSRGPHLTGMTPFKKGGEERGEELYPDETFTYRGPLNLVSYYVGIHVAHHDFPFVAGFNLAEVERLAPEYYEHLPVTKSWPGTIYDYIMGDGNPFDRVKRKSAEAESKKTS
jgi:sphingolipid delta-4 desaturase